MTGIICVNKPAGITSFGVVAKVRGITKEKKCGHTGTLDPMATGVLPIMLGSATRFLNYLPDSDKGYRARFILGKTTDTLDITGEVTGTFPVNADAADIAAVLPQFTGTIQQLPPMYSAKSVDGVRLYELARRGIAVERQPCTVTVKELKLLGEANGEYTVEVLCSKGTYIRSLIDDIGRTLGCGAVMTALERTQAMGFTLADCVSLEALEAMKDSGDFSPALHRLEDLFAAYQQVTVSEAQARRFANGGALDMKRVKASPCLGETVTVRAPDGAFLGLGKNTGEELAAVRLLPHNN
ncbi:MAG: tRNA pseudouridine(55) synthase TruB [Eubacterium sp.]|nr:tRNA pseudouridine(55) synthase TruB [Eubacterium sp.]